MQIRSALGAVIFQALARLFCSSILYMNILVFGSGERNRRVSQGFIEAQPQETRVLREE